MTTSAVAFMLLFWAFVLGLGIWCFSMLFSTGARYKENDQDGGQGPLVQD
jgi:hypothetical protein